MAKAQAGIKQSNTRPPNPKRSEAAAPGTTPLNFKIPVDFRREFKPTLSSTTKN
ncbi:hypothetical protein [Bradyrhizobium sp. NBAIM01]|uniref:hypothetical protein n=1 Tax=Bradyrhizobium sp. NBAIM01 TaxID=2793818 RepID=UPI001CD6E5F5|nr:hypothetical protein [Bradyrhizobium sp. NBAIM01]MCA1510451.1 hypothetical protein [Bradyrhizobium sp. NBAIM01]